MVHFDPNKTNFNVQGFFTKKAPEQKEAAEVEKTVPVAETKTSEAEALKGLAVQGQATVAKTVHKEDIKECNELAAFLPENLKGVTKYFTPLNVASVAKVVTEGNERIGNTVTAGNAETLFASAEFKAVDKLFS